MTKYSINGEKINATTDNGAARILNRWIKAGKASKGDYVEAYRSTDGQHYSVNANGNCAF